jgi:archaellum component FlaC
VVWLRYQALQAQFEVETDEARRDKIEEALTALLGNIEKNRDAMGALAKELNRIKAELKKVGEAVAAGDGCVLPVCCGVEQGT